MEEFEHHDIVEATFDPKRTDTLRPGSIPFIGQRLRFSAAWPITENDGGPYVGQWAFLSYDRAHLLGWVPTEDLKDIVNLTALGAGGE